MNVLGIDACKMGWCVVGRMNDALVWGCYESIKEVITAYPDVERTLIDIPIGLSSDRFTRTVDQKARTYLDKRKSSLFSPPCRKAVYASNYKDALELNRKITGKGISVQAYNISAKIKEVDQWLNTEPKDIEVFEAHPELCFKTLNQNQDIQFSKHTKEGIELRKQVLFRYEEELKSVIQNLIKSYKRTQVKLDDILDAMALYLINKNSEKLKIISDENSIDETGKKVGIVFG